MNEQLYLESQVLLVVHLLASTRLDSSGQNENGWYSSEKLCREIYLDPNIVKRTLSYGAINPTWPEPETAFAFSTGASDE